MNGAPQRVGDRDNLASGKVYVPCAGLPFIAGRENLRLYDILLAARPGHDVIAGSSDVFRLLAPIRKNGLHGGRDADTPGPDFAILAIFLPSRSRASAIACSMPSSSPLPIGVIQQGSHLDLSGRHLEGARVPKPQPFRLLL